MRDKDQDDLSGIILVYVDNILIAPVTPPSDGSPGNPIVGSLADGVHSSDIIAFKDANPPVNAPSWEFSFDLDGAPYSIVRVLFVFLNHHGVPKHDVERFLVKLGFAIAGGAVGGVIPGGTTGMEALKGIVGGVIGTLGGEGLAALINDPPECQGAVYSINWYMTVDGLNALAYSDVISTDPYYRGEIGQYSYTSSSEPITDAKPECGHPPDYSLTFSIIRKAEQYVGSFGSTSEVIKRWYIPASGRSLEQWVGSWSFPAVISSTPRIACEIYLSQIEPETLHVSLVEHFGNWNGSEIANLNVNSLKPASQEFVMYSADILPGRRVLHINPAVFQMQESFSKLKWKGGAPAFRSEFVSGSVGRITGAVGSLLSDQVRVFMSNFVEHPDTLMITDKGVSLGLYIEFEESRTETREVGPVIRYMRDNSELVTRTDVMLHRVPRVA